MKKNINAEAEEEKEELLDEEYDEEYEEDCEDLQPGKENITQNVFFDCLEIMEAAFVTIFLFLLVFTYLLRPVTVDGSSMEPTLYNNDRLLILTSLKKADNGDIIVLDNQDSALFADDAETQLYPTDGLNIVLVKRLIAKGGQEINIDFVNGTVAVDGVQLPEDYIKDLTTRNDGAFTYPFRVPEGYIFVMGDNRLGSTDSRSPAVGLIPEEEIIGIVCMRYSRDSERCQSWKDRFAIYW